MTGGEQDSKIAMLERENEVLRERVDALEREFMGALLVFPVAWCLTANEQRIMGVLLSRPEASKDQIMTALYRDTHRDEAEIKIVDVFVCKVRRKLKPFGVAIRTIWGVGYAIDEPQRGLLKKALAQDAESSAARSTFDLIAEGACS